MRFSIASVAVMAGAVAAVPQYSVQPISQISDGQIQAPPATSMIPAVPMPSASMVSEIPAVPMPSGSMVSGDMTSTVAVTETASVTSVVVVPTATPVVPGASMSVPMGSNTTMATGTGSMTASTPASEETSSGVAGSATESGDIPESTGAAAGNMVSFGGLVLAIGAAIVA
ncbi:hypothetical protein J4E91_002711 [Alternaria rosae]|uniref:uncharacterized protein n=1 Tax=Alternaria rosae TaxID=1187941 RepID=UPI001E8EB5FE|nr:uncharacterized protein BKA58DRAFT_453161 [Alternaria rosae]KAH6878946.1 hypothetical protein BKA58DRAFT_453161 [Alternaria rosae]KAI4953863.1 hypothetical protein J4E91_002711 [Alternaria rosae]